MSGYYLEQPPDLPVGSYAYVTFGGKPRRAKRRPVGFVWPEPKKPAKKRGKR